jgi:CDP-glycerol glycerophosphotransferase
MKRLLFTPIIIFFYYFFRIFPVNKNKIFVVNFNGKGYGDNPKYIVKEILRRKLNYTIVWSARKEYLHSFPLLVKTVKYNSLRAIYEAATAGIWIDNCRKQLYEKKRKNQFYINTLHSGAGGIKKVEKDVEKKLSPYYVKQAKYDSTIANLFLSCSKFNTNLYRQAYWYKGEIFECGASRVDILINQDSKIKEEIINHFHIAPDKKIILYAPTFRDNFDPNFFDLNFSVVLDTLKWLTNKDWIFLLRLHPNISKKSNLLSFSDSIINATLYDDMQELLLASDILISDYSGCMFDFALMKKPVFLYIRDYNEYKTERGFYTDMSALPFPVALNNNKLLEHLKNFDQPEYEKNLQTLFNDIHPFDDGKASQRVVDRIIKETSF